jgi:hypothetical protein
LKRTSRDSIRQWNRVADLHPLDEDSASEDWMRFRLTYEGALRPTQRDASRPGEKDGLAEHKQIIRRAFHRQFKELWATNKFLSSFHVTRGQHDDVFRAVADMSRDYGSVTAVSEPLVESIARNYEEFGFRYVPLVRDKISLLCTLEVLFLRRDIPGKAIEAGDLDNRIKTLIDCLRRPRNANEVPENDTPGVDENPFFCLLDDDKAVTGFSVETDTLLEPPSGDPREDQRRAKIIVTVKLNPYDVTYFNLSFAGG